MKLLYRIAITLITAVLPVLGIFNVKINHFLKGRKGLLNKLKEFRSKNSGDLVWFHVASLGEYEQAKPVIAQLKLKRPAIFVLVSFFSPSGYDIATRKVQEHVDFISYIPLDRKSWAFEFVKIMNPSLVFFVKYDLWHHHILALKRNGIPIILFSASFRPDQRYFKSNGFFRNILSQMDKIFTQNLESLRLLESIAYKNGFMVGDTRFDRVNETALSPKKFPEIEKWVENEKVVVLGSVWEEDMKLLIPLINQNQDYLWIIAPHDINSEPMRIWAQVIEANSIRYSQSNNFTGKRILFIDNIGMLSSLYQYATLAYVGGAFGKGLHNILEPLGFEVPVIFGTLKNPSKFPEAAQSVRENCGFSVKDKEELQLTFNKLKDGNYYDESKLAAKNWVESNLGAARKIVDEVLLNYPLNGR